MSLYYIAYLRFLSAGVKEIKINDKKKKMMERFLLYEENKINTCELFEDLM